MVQFKRKRNLSEDNILLFWSSLKFVVPHTVTKQIQNLLPCGVVSCVISIFIC